MKTTIAVLLLFSSLATYSQSRDEIVKSKIEAKLKETMHDPSTYEFVSLTPSGTITWLHNIYSKRKEIEREIESNQLDLKVILDYPNLLDSDDDFEMIKSLKIEIDKDHAMLNKIDSVEKALAGKVNTPVAYNYTFKCRGKNAAGASVLSEYVLQVDAPKLEIMNMASGTEAVITEFGDFPGYQTLVGRAKFMRRAVAREAQAFADSVREHVRSQSQGVTVRQVSNVESTNPVDSISDDRIYTVVEQLPEFKGGYEALLKFIRKNLQYPATAKSTAVEGTVYVTFVTIKDGSIEDVNVVRGLSAECDQEAIRLVKSMPKWKPGKRNGTPANVRVVLPIKFPVR
jgi:TonB family protein